jgi:hypothetical protein
MDTENQNRHPFINERQTSEEDWQAKVDRLQEVVRGLLIKNQTMRMSLSAETPNQRFSELS